MFKCWMPYRIFHLSSQPKLAVKLLHWSPIIFASIFAFAWIIGPDKGVPFSSRSLQFLFNCYYNMFSFSRHCLESLLNEILKLHCKKRAHVNLPLVCTRQLFATNWQGEAQRCLTAGSSGNVKKKAFRLIEVRITLTEVLLYFQSAVPQGCTGIEKLMVKKCYSIDFFHPQIKF
jgi:hypothetical protein